MTNNSTKKNCCYKNNTLLYKIQPITNTKGPLVEH